MDIGAEKAKVLERFEKVSDLSLIRAVKNLLDYGLSKQKVEGIKLSFAQKTEIDQRLEKYERGETKFKSWEEAKAGIRKRSKNVL